MSLINDQEAAKRLARHIASDLSLYFEKKVVEGIENDNFFAILEKEIDEGRAHYESKVSADLRSKTNFYERAIIDVLLKSKAHIKSKIW